MLEVEWGAGWGKGKLRRGQREDWGAGGWLSRASFHQGEPLTLKIGGGEMGPATSSSGFGLNIRVIVQRILLLPRVPIAMWRQVVPVSPVLPSPFFT